MAHTATPTKSKSRQPVDSKVPAFQTRRSRVELAAIGARRATFGGHAGRPQLFGLGSLMRRCLMFRGPNGGEKRVGA
jgi:hypothetical protein